MNNTITIRAKTPLLRPGLEIETEVSARYAVQAMREVMEIVREFNSDKPPSVAEKVA